MTVTVQRKNGASFTTHRLFDIISVDHGRGTAVIKDKKENEIYTMNSSGCLVVEEMVYCIQYNPLTSKNLEQIPSMKDPSSEFWYTHFCKKYGTDNVEVKGKDGFYRFNISEIRNSGYFERIQSEDKEGLLLLTRRDSFTPREGVGIETKDWFNISQEGGYYYWRLTYETSYWSRWIDKNGKYNEEYYNHYLTNEEIKEKENLQNLTILEFKLAILRDYIETLYPNNNFNSKFNVFWTYDGKGEYVAVPSFSCQKLNSTIKVKELKKFIEYQNYSSGDYDWKVCN